ncbi:GNAT family N-acetyltransferase [Streptomyces sp. NBC_01591]|uniref:GNAT family N-acetyltransferase n=1 Tax=Streptomyces sp. NBC_01591 TaxID=2975888 RepID=UPI002DDB932C|nr:GNAT family N-acetyltransferase [Streptomyces sp. NBC_01591]WSD72721.1 GNAT family N-acetyltransferase [Streptomyces sp. NBC_01591]
MITARRSSDARLSDRVRSATGRGVATRAARALVELAFRLPGVDYVEVVHDPANTASRAVPAGSASPITSAAPPSASPRPTPARTRSGD